MSEQKNESQRKCSYCYKQVVTPFEKEVVYRRCGRVESTVLEFCDKRCYGNYQMGCEG